jgi:hypothetical protein
MPSLIHTTTAGTMEMCGDSSSLCEFGTANNTFSLLQVISDTAGFKTWWTTVAKRYAANDHVIFDTNNEYHDMDNTLVYDLNQAAIDGIRAAGATSQYIFVEGNSWTGAWTWVTSTNPDQITSTG